MRDFVIITDTCCDLPIEYIKEKNIPYISLTCQYNGREYSDDFGQTLTHKKFFNDLRNGTLPTTSLANASSYYNMFEKIAKDKKDIIYIGVSSGLSGSINSAHIAKNMMLEKYSDVSIFIVDILTASLGQGLMIIKAIELQEAGKSSKEIVDYLENTKQNLNTYITVNDLSHLKRSGRISSGAAAVGIVLHIKPIICINRHGKVMPVLKIKGRKKSINKLADICAERIIDPEEQTIAICHGDCLIEAEKLKSEIEKRITVKKVLLHYIGPVVGRFGGPGAIGLFFLGKPRQHSHVIK